MHYRIQLVSVPNWLDKNSYSGIYGFAQRSLFELDFEVEECSNLILNMISELGFIVMCCNSHS